MSEQGTTKDLVSLEDLKRALAAVPAWPEYQSNNGMLALMTDAGEHHARRADAWRTYARLIEQWVHCIGSPCTCDAAEAARLVRENLR